MDETDFGRWVARARAADLLDEDIAKLAESLAASGERFQALERSADLASTGGPGSLSTLWAPAILAASGYKVPELGVPGRPAGGVDVLAQVPGYRVNLNRIEAKAVLDDCGYVNLLAGNHFAPADAAMFAYRQRVGAQGIPALAIASLLAKKLVMGVQLVGLEVRVARHGNFGQDVGAARRNARRFCDVAQWLGLGSLCIVTDGNRLLQPYIGRGEAILALARLLDGEDCPWLVRTYGRGTKPDASLAFNPDTLPRAVQVEASTLAKLQALAKEREDAAVALAEEQAARIKSEEDRAALDAELKKLQAEIAAIKAANQKAEDAHDYNEAQTRDTFIDLLLGEAGWPLDQERDREYPVKGMPNSAEEGFVDYVLWGDDGKPLAVIEAKRTKRDPRVGQQQAKLYADCLEQEFSVRPLIFYTNGYEHWLWDDERYPPRAVHGFLKKDELELWRQRKANRRTLSATSIDADIVERYYQTRAIRRVGEVFEKDHQRKALLVMATGSGKTRTVIALIDQLMRANWCKRVLFLADRVALVKQAHNNFKAHLPSAPSANLIEKHDPKKNDHNGARVCVATYPTMMGLIDEMQNGQRKYGPGHFDLIVIDEAHRSIYRKYRAIFDYFDSLLVGLTATPRDEIDRDTYLRHSVH